MPRDRLRLLGGAAVTARATLGGSRIPRTVGDIDDGVYQT
jgi:hypothetical protein